MLVQIISPPVGSVNGAIGRIGTNTDGFLAGIFFNTSVASRISGDPTAATQLYVQPGFSGVQVSGTEWLPVLAWQLQVPNIGGPFPSSTTLAVGNTTLTAAQWNAWLPGVNDDVYATNCVLASMFLGVDVANLNMSVPATATNGMPVTVTVTAVDSFGNTFTGYGGTVTLTSSDSAATLPAAAALTSGVGTFSVTLNTVGSFMVTAADGTFTVASSAITVS